MLIQNKKTEVYDKLKPALFVYVCVCVLYVYSTFYLLHIISDAGELHLPIPFAIPDIRQLRYLPCYTPTTFPHPIRLLEFFSSCPSLLSPLDLATPERDQGHNRPIRQLWFLSYVRLFVVRAAKEHAVRPH